MPGERSFKLGVNHRRLEPMAVEAVRKHRKAAGKQAQNPRLSWARARQDD